MTRALRHQSVKPMTAACCTADDVSFFVEGTDAAGELTGTDLRLRVPLGDATVRSAWSKGLTAPRARERAWAANPTCVECNGRILAPHLSGLLETSEGPRVAHKRNCFVRAVARINPALSTTAALRRGGR